MSSVLNHLQINVATANLPFYKDLFAQLKWNLIHDTPDMLGLLDKNGASIWFAGKEGSSAADYDGIGVNHIALGVSDQGAVDEMVSYLGEKKVACLFDTPRHRPEFSASEDRTYYQVMFESPDRLLFEVVYMGPKAN